MSRRLSSRPVARLSSLAVPQARRAKEHSPRGPNLSRRFVLTRNAVLPLLGERVGVRGKALPETPAIPSRSHARPALSAYRFPAFRFFPSRPAMITRTRLSALRPTLELASPDSPASIRLRKSSTPFPLARRQLRSHLLSSRLDLRSPQTRLTPRRNALTARQNGLTSRQTEMTSAQPAMTSAQNIMTPAQNAVPSACAGLTSPQNGLTSARSPLISTGRWMTWSPSGCYQPKTP